MVDDFSSDRMLNTRAPVTAVKLSEQVAARLRAEIIAGVHASGQPLRLDPLAQRLEVSTTPIREALAILERQSLVESQPHRGYRVTDLKPEDFADVYSLHAHMVR